MIYKVDMNWEQEVHTFEFLTDQDRTSSLDFLNDFIGSLRELYQTVLETDEDTIPKRFSVRGGHSFTTISPKKTIRW